MENKKRMAFVDIARGIAIILVVLGHCDNFNSYFRIEKFNGLFFMPLFIFISGYFSKENKIVSFKKLYIHLKKRIPKLYLFYLRWELLFLILTNIFFKIGFYSSGVDYGGKNIYPITSLKILLKKIIEIIFLMGREPFCGAFWFIISLIFIIIGYSVINYFVNKLFGDRTEKLKNIFIGIIMILLFFIGCVMSKTINIPRISPSITMMIFYYLGYMSNNLKIKFNNIYIVLFNIITLSVLYNFGSVSMNSNSFPNGWFLITSSLSGIYLCMFISKKIENTKLSGVFEYIGKNTLPIIALHFISFKFAMIIQYLLGYISYSDIAYLKGYNNDNLFYILYVICGICIPLLLNKFFSIVVCNVKNFYKKCKF